ncbi:MAG: DEAD/DEAH box helicase, partial [Synergistaceae bacterium]|nr:DEAD/DEAH box helicase [Synergistaceae bacterium]
PAGLKIAMTGTPVENNLSNLWSLFDFLNKGLLGSANEFRKFTKQIEEIPHGYQKLRNIISPFILRRLKTDKSIISDLPDKMEMIDYVTLSSRQIVLYHKAVEDFRKVMENRELSKFRRSGLILETLTQLKQICNHPDQYLDGKNYTPSDSGKFEMLREICETIHENREKVLIFTQFKKIVEYLAEYLSGIFHRQGLIIHGDVTPEKRTKLVETFNTTNHNPFMLLSLKTAGVGLNLVGANHVIHFDRWWNPAVENQATDRAFRIGQTKNVFVHKFVAKGTIEERINDMLESKKSLAENVIGSGENWITELSNQEILDMMRLAV